MQGQLETLEYGKREKKTGGMGMVALAEVVQRRLRFKSGGSSTQMGGKSIAIEILASTQKRFGNGGIPLKKYGRSNQM